MYEIFSSFTLITETYFDSLFKWVPLSGVLLALQRKVNQDIRLIKTTNFTVDDLNSQTKLCTKNKTKQNTYFVFVKCFTKKSHANDNPFILANILDMANLEDIK